MISFHTTWRRTYTLDRIGCHIKRGEFKPLKYPDDANGDVLRRMEEAGRDLTRPCNIDFTIVFPNENSAEQFARQFHALGYAASIQLTEVDKKCPWDVVVVKNMIPTHEGITAFEDFLQQVAGSFGGHNDGWGTLSETPPSPS